MPVYTINTSKNTEEDQYEGKVKVANGNLTFLETDFLKAYEHGGIIILEEINLVDPGVSMGAIGQAIEFPFVLMKDGYQPVRRHPMCIILGTFNVGTDGSRPINQGFSSRFKQTYMIDDPTKDDFISILMSQGYEKKRCKWIYDVYSKIYTYLKGPDVNKEEYAMYLSLRTCLGALENMEEGDSPKEAARNSLIGKIAEVDLETAREVEKNVLDIVVDIR
jgi:midasin (ATPase involved in ribosome maturation)